MSDPDGYFRVKPYHADLRVAVEGLHPACHSRSGLNCEADAFGWCYLISRADVLALIPEGAVLVTEQGLARAMDGENIYLIPGTEYVDLPRFAAAILRHLRETP
jgi:hypothetical protein